MADHFSIEFLIFLLMIASGVAVIALAIRIPYTVALVLSGLALGAFNSFLLPRCYSGPRPDWLTPEVILFFFLPGLLFEGSIKISYSLLRRNLLAIATLATVGIVVASIVTAFVVHWAIGMPVFEALLFGAAISATDPISVLSIFERMGVTRRLSLLIEAESLFNDGTAAVLFQIFAVAAVTHEFNVTAGIEHFLLSVGGGGVVGFLLTYLMNAATSQIDEPRIEITLTTILAYGSYLVASHLHFSGVIATVVAGITVGNTTVKKAMSARTRIALWSFWEYASFVINSIVFLLIGSQVQLGQMLQSWRMIGLAVVAVLLGRVLCVYGLIPITNLSREKISGAWQHVLVWGGLHGALSLALVLSLDRGFPERARLLVLTFGVVAFSIIVQGMTITPLIEFLKIVRPERDEDAVARVAQMALADARAELESLLRTHAVSHAVYETLRRDLDDRAQQFNQDIVEEAPKQSAMKEAEMITVRMRLVAAEKSSIEQAVHDGLISASAAARIIESANRELDRLKSER